MRLCSPDLRRLVELDVPSQQLIKFFRRVGDGDVLQQVLDVGLRVELVEFGRFNQRVPGGARLGAVGGVGEQPILAADRKRANGVFGQRVADPQVAPLALTDQVFPLVQLLKP